MRCTRSSRLLAVALLLLGAATGRAQVPRPADKDLDPATIKAYADLGGVYGRIVERYPFFVAAKDKPSEGIPGFRFTKFPNARLPDVAAPFGLDLRECGVGDAGLKNLAHLQNLVALDLKDSNGDRSEIGR